MLKAQATKQPRSVRQEGEEIALATRMIKLGARLQLLQKATGLSVGRLARLYHEIMGRAPSKGMLPYSTEWFIGWHPNLHASLFYSLFLSIKDEPAVGSEIEAVVRAYEMYLDHDEVTTDKEPVLSLTRAWTLLRFVENNMLHFTPCSSCSIATISYPYEIAKNYRCSVCSPPIRIASALSKDKPIHP